MERVRQAMELALKENWEPQVCRKADAASVPAAQARSPAAPRQASTPPGAPEPQRDAPTPPPVAAPRSDLPDPAHGRPAPHVVPVAGGTLAGNRLVAAIKEDPQREAYCLLQSVVCELMSRKNASVLGVTGPGSGCGKTLTAVNLAASIALDARRQVLLVDLDLRRPGVHRCFGLDATAGVEACLFGGVALPDALSSPSIDGLTVLPALGGSTAVGQILRSSTLRALLDELRTLFPESIVVIDLPPAANADDAATIDTLVDAVLLVVEDGVTKEADYRRTLGNVDKSKLLGTVLNHAQPSRARKSW